jgi:hypothetical protein
MNHNLFSKNVISMILILDFRKRKFLNLGDDFDVSSLGRVEIPKPHPQLQCNEENLDCLDKSGWSLGVMWVSDASIHPWVSVARTLRNSSSSVNLHGGLINRIFIDVSFIRHYSESPLTISYHHFMDICDCVCLSRGWRPLASWIIQKILTPVFKSFKPFRKHSNPVYERDSIVTISLFYQLDSFSSCIASLETKMFALCSVSKKLLQHSARYKILNTTEHERHERNDWPSTRNMMEESAYKDKVKHVPASF